MSVTRPDRRVVTFYSFKGGVGRSMSLANVAFRLASTHGLRVIAVDWDLEAPGLHRFFGLHQDTVAGAQGVLDYFIEWRSAIERNDPEPPDVTGWLLPINEKPHAPRYGSLSLLVAGRPDATYDRRLASLDWRSFYNDSAGAAAVETLREQLVEAADVVLIDSRTGHTDAGGICTIQIPDAVVLLTAPNEQSLEGTEQIAQRIAKADDQERAGRKRPKVWLSVARVPSVEETYLTEEWFKSHGEWFSGLIEQGLWRKDDHTEGMRSFEIPHRGRWGVGETLLNNPLTAHNDPLFLAYERLTRTVFRWLVGMDEMTPPQPAVEQSAEDQSAKIEVLRTRVTEAEQRGDATGLTLALIDLATELNLFNRWEDALLALDRASAAAVGGGSRADYAVINLAKVHSLTFLERFKEARAACEEAIKIGRELDSVELKAVSVFALGVTELHINNHDAALSALTEALDLFRASSLRDRTIRIIQSIEIAHRSRELFHDNEVLRAALDEIRASKPAS